MDIVKLERVPPLVLFDIKAFKCAVGDSGGLNEGQVVADYLAVRVPLG